MLISTKGMKTAKAPSGFVKAKRSRCFFSWPSCVQKSLCYLSSCCGLRGKLNLRGAFRFTARFPELFIQSRDCEDCGLDPSFWEEEVKCHNLHILNPVTHFLLCSNLYASSSLTVYQFTSSLFFVSWGL